MARRSKPADRPGVRAAPARCINCTPFFLASKGAPGMGLCARFPKHEVIRNAEGHWCGEHPALTFEIV